MDLHKILRCFLIRKELAATAGSAKVASSRDRQHAQRLVVSRTTVRDSNDQWRKLTQVAANTLVLETQLVNAISADNDARSGPSKTRPFDQYVRYLPVVVVVAVSRESNSCSIQVQFGDSRPSSTARPTPRKSCQQSTKHWVINTQDLMPEGRDRNWFACP